MILFDTSVVIDARDPGSPWHEWAKRQVAKAVAEDEAGANAIVVAEASVRAVDRVKVPQLLEQMGMTLLPVPVSAAVPAAAAYGLYLDRVKAAGKQDQTRTPLPDFLIGAHAAVTGFKLVTRDPKRVATYFPTVELITP